MGKKSQGNGKKKKNDRVANSQSTPKVPSEVAQRSLDLLHEVETQLHDITESSVQCKKDGLLGQVPQQLCGMSESVVVWQHQKLEEMRKDLEKNATTLRERLISQAGYKLS